MFQQKFKLAVAAALGVATFAASAAHAATCPAGYPSGPITFEVGYSAGGGTDSVARKAASLMQEQNGWTIIVKNRPGASGGVMAKGIRTAGAEGLRVGVGSTTTMAINPYKSKDIDYTYKDFSYLGMGMMLNYGLVGLTGKPFTDLESFLAYAKEKGGATVSVGAASYDIAVRSIAKHFGVKLIPVPTKGSSRALKDALGGHVDATMQGTAHVAQIKSGKMVQLATLTNERAIYAPNVKTLSESGMDFAIEGHIVFFVPKDTKPEIHQCLSEALKEVTESAKYKEMMTNLQTRADNKGPEGTTAYLAKNDAFYKKALAK